MTCNLAVFRITDGEFTVNLLDPAGFSITEWQPAIPAFKGGGTWGDSAFVDNSYPVFGVYENAEETLTVTMSASSANTAALKLQNLRRLLRQASVFWFGRLGPVWLEARLHGEDNTRYAVLTYGHMPNDGVVFSQPGLQIAGAVTMAGLTIQLRRLHWTANLPGIGTDTGLQQTATYNGTIFGTVDESGNLVPTTLGVHVSNKQNMANLTNIHNGTGGSNLLNTPFPWVLFDGGSTVLFGIAASVANSGPFSSLVFNTSPATGDAVITWEYLSAAATWSALENVVDNTINFQQDTSITGELSVNWRQPAFNAAASPGGGLPVGFWVRARISSGTFSDEPEQTGHNIYTVTKPYFDIEVDQVDGDIPALASLDFIASSMAGNNFTTRIIGGIKTLRDDNVNFEPFINISSEQNPTGITVSSSFFVSHILAATGIAAIDSAVLTETESTLATIVIDDSVAYNYAGKFRLILRGRGGSGDSYAYAVIEETAQSGGTLATFTTRKENLNEDGADIIDLGLVNLPLAGKHPRYVRRGPGNIKISLIADNRGPDTESFTFFDLVFIPVDEWSFDTVHRGTTAASLLAFYNQLRVDNIEQYFPRATLLEDFLNFPPTGPGIVSQRESGGWNLISSGQVRLNAGVKQRLVLLTDDYYATPDPVDGPDSRAEAMLKVTVRKQQQYFSLRGEF